MDINQNTDNLSRIIRILRNKSANQKHVDIMINGIATRSIKRCTNEFNKQFTPHPKRTKQHHGSFTLDALDDVIARQ